VACTLNIILKIPKILWNIFTSSGTDVEGARQYSFEFNFSPQIRSTLVYSNIHNIHFLMKFLRRLGWPCLSWFGNHVLICCHVQKPAARRPLLLHI